MTKETPAKTLSELDNTDITEITSRIDEIITTLESEDIALEKAISQYEEGVNLLSIAQGKLRDAEQRIQLLSERHQMEEKCDVADEN